MDVFEPSCADESLKQEIFCSLKEAQTVISIWQNACNRVRPHSSLVYRLPRPSRSRIWPSGYPWLQPCSSLSGGLGQNAGQVSASIKVE